MPEQNRAEITLGDGKYKVVLQSDPHKFVALRYDQPWQDLTGNNLILAMFQRILDLQELVCHEWEPTDTEGHSLQCKLCGTEITIDNPEVYDKEFDGACSKKIVAKKEHVCACGGHCQYGKMR
jgi:hypothetical protein